METVGLRLRDSHDLSHEFSFFHRQQGEDRQCLSGQHGVEYSFNVKQWTPADRWIQQSLSAIVGVFLGAF